MDSILLQNKYFFGVLHSPIEIVSLQIFYGTFREGIYIYENCIAGIA
jgi:hypothetical protein